MSDIGNKLMPNPVALESNQFLSSDLQNKYVPRLPFTNNNFNYQTEIEYKKFSTKHCFKSTKHANNSLLSSQSLLADSVLSNSNIFQRFVKQLAKKLCVLKNFVYRQVCFINKI